jgi:protocatechuate 3,4-dioxygenase beta subunit
LLHKLDSPPIPDQTVTTDANGVYSFSSLPSGQYRITETPPTGFANDASHANSPLTKILAQTPQSFDVQLSDFSQLQTSYVSRNSELLTAVANGDVGLSNVGQMNLTVTEPDVSFTTPTFASLCVDFYRDIHLNDSNLPYDGETLAAAFQTDTHVVNPLNASAIAYLYNTVVNDPTNPWSTDPAHYVPVTEAAGMQLAVWELEYEHNPAPYDVLSGTFVVQGLNATSPEVIAAQGFLAQATAQAHPDQLAIYLNGLPISGRANGSQGLIAPMSFNFTNTAKASPSISTTPNSPSLTLSDATPPLRIDTATLSGGNNPTGTITFTLSLNGTVVDTETVTVNGDGTYSTPNGFSIPRTGSVTGTYQWDATYSGDANNLAVSDNGNANEQVVVSPASPAIATTPDSTAITLGANPVVLKDTAALSGGFHPTGTITFTLSLNGTVVDTENATVNGNGSYTTPTGYTLPNTGTVTGTYQWNATYNGDSNNNSVSDNGNANEQVTITSAMPAFATTPDPTSAIAGPTPVVLKDTADLSGGYHPTGTITFTLSLNGTVVDTENVTVNGNGSYTTPTGFALPTNGSGAGTYQWDASYSGDTNNHSATDNGNPNEQVNVASHVPVPDSLSGHVFDDCNNNGVQDTNESPLPGVTITLVGTTTTGGSVFQTTTTDANGLYTFSGLATGTYMVTQTMPAGYLPGKVIPGSLGGVSDFTTRTISQIALPPGTNGINYNFAEFTPSSLSGFVYFDVFHNGVLDVNDFGIAHVKVDLEGTNDLGQSVLMTTVTDENGFYGFVGLRPGTYNIIREQPAIFRKFKNNVGTAGGTATADAFINISLSGCTDGVNYNFGELQKPGCRLRSLAIHIGNVFWHFEQTYQRNPAGFAQTYPELVNSIANGQVPWGKPPFPRAPVATHWVPRLGTKPIKIFPVHGIKFRPLLPAAPGLAHAATKIAVKTAPAVVAHTPTTHPKGPSKAKSGRR